MLRLQASRAIGQVRLHGTTIDWYRSTSWSDTPLHEVRAALISAFILYDCEDALAAATELAQTTDKLKVPSELFKLLEVTAAGICEASPSNPLVAIRTAHQLFDASYELVEKSVFLEQAVRLILGANKKRDARERAKEIWNIDVPERRSARTGT